MPVRNAVARMILLIAWLQSGGQTVTQLQRRLEAVDCKVSVWTIRRDLMHLGLPPLSCPLRNERGLWLWEGDPERWLGESVIWRELRQSARDARGEG